MDTQRILGELRAERDKLSRAIAALEGLVVQGQRVGQRNVELYQRRLQLSGSGDLRRSLSLAQFPNGLAIYDCSHRPSF